MLTVDFSLDDAIVSSIDPQYTSSTVLSIIRTTIDACPEWAYLLNHCVTVSVHTTVPSVVRQYNRRYRNKDTSTNIMSFPAALPDQPLVYVDETTVFLGDLLVCQPTVSYEAQVQHKTWMQHATHLLVHGTLHLLHYDHITDQDAAVMEAIETRIMHDLGWPCPYTIP